jgi:hypothetical protein
VPLCSEYGQISSECTVARPELRIAIVDSLTDPRRLSAGSLGFDFATTLKGFDHFSGERLIIHYEAVRCPQYGKCLEIT